MKQLSIILVLLCLFQNIDAQPFYDTTYYPNGKISGYATHDKNKNCCWLKYKFFYNGSVSHIDRYDSSDFSHHSVNAFNIDGSPAFKYTSYHGRPTGLFERNYSDGKIRKRGQFYNGFKTGVWSEYYPGGQIQSEYVYRLSKEDSAFNIVLNYTNMDTLNISFEHIEWGEADSSLGPRFQFINISHFQFPYLNSVIPPTWKKYNLGGKIIERNTGNKKTGRKNRPATPADPNKF